MKNKKNYNFSALRKGLYLTFMLFILGGHTQRINAEEQQNVTKHQIVSVGSSITEIIVELGLEDSLVAVDSTSRNLVSEDMPKLGYHRQLNAEGVIALTPTLLIASDEAGPQTSLDMIQQSGIDVHVTNSGNDVKDLIERIKDIGEFTNHQTQAKSLIEQVNQKNDQLAQQRSEHPSDFKAVFLLTMQSRSLNISGENTPADALIRLIGMKNPALEMNIQNYKPVSAESILAMAPDVILISERTLKQFGTIDDFLAQNPVLQQTPAGQAKRIWLIDGRALIGGLGLSTLDEAMRVSENLL